MCLPLVQLERNEDLQGILRGNNHLFFIDAYTKSYFLQTIKDKAKGMMSPKAVLLDFEEALSEAFVKGGG